MKHLTLLPILALALLGCSGGSQGEGKPVGLKTDKPAEVFARPIEGDVLKDSGIDAYPGAKLVKQEQLASDSMSPDELRYTVVATTPDAAEKVLKFYEGRLKAKSDIAQGKGMLVTRTDRGNDIIINTEAKDKLTETTYKIIIYKK